jgi:hypothetical protein
MQGKSLEYLGDEKIAKVYAGCRGSLTKTAANLDTSRTTLYARMQNSPDLKRLMAEQLESRLDLAEDSLMTLVKKKDFQATKFYLETIGKKRGYGKSVEITGNEKKPLRTITTEMTVEQAAEAYAATIYEDEEGDL